MQKILIASDIHGSAYWCQKLLEAFEKEGAEKLVLLGDLLYHGPRNDFPKNYAPKEVFAMLNAVKDKLVCVRGNCDSEVDQMVLDFPMMADYALLPWHKRNFFLTHGHLFNQEILPPLQTGDLLFNGHFHTPEITPLTDGVRYVNCGSVSLPKEGTPHSFIVATCDKLIWKNLATGESFMEEIL
ncbi:MAG: phosphodiesterase [Clostridia bacterium]|nr:phosphodiesterase [Clostridia bacterium]